MKPIRCLAIDDEPIALKKLENYIGKIPYLELAGLCDSAFAAMQVMAETQIDAVFLDINMPDLSGIDFISAVPKPPMIVFTTAYAEYALESYRLSAVDYLLKPISFADFQRAAGKLLKQFKSTGEQARPAGNNRQYLLIKDGYKYVNINTRDIIYIKAMNDYVQLFRRNGDPILTHLPMKQMIESLPENFLQIHRSYIVNTDHILEIERQSIVMPENVRITVGDNFREVFNAFLQSHSAGNNKH